MKHLLIALTYFFYTHASGQSNKAFVIKEIRSENKTIKDFETKTTNFYEDDSFVVRKTCSGEWGGSIFFKDKKTGIEYSCAATCPVVVNKLNGKYIVTNTLAHLRGFSEVLEINDPRLMEVLKYPKPKKKKAKLIKYVGDDESKSDKGRQSIVDSVGVLTMATFLYKEQLFHIVTNFNETFVAKIENKKYVTVDTLSKERIWTYNPEVIVTADKHYIVFFENQEAKGYLDIFENNITIVKFN